ncbi:MAG: dynamin family protein [Anaerolineae bacterium]|nr:dynamin family protein [Anaerolineae bacterium]
MRDALFHTDNPFLIVLVGPFSAGKSAIINALVGAPVLEMGPTPTTTRITILRHGPDDQEIRTSDNVYTRFYPAPILEKVSFVDTPGLESVFTVHDEITHRFLHRADVVFLVMFATQALPRGSMDDLRDLLNYGKPVNLLVNQADLLEPGEADEVRAFIAEECRRYLGVVPEIWLVSARTGLEAAAQVPDDPRWYRSGLGAVLQYIDERLNDEERLRRKLQTPIKIGQHVARETLALVQDDLEQLGDHQRAVQNLQAQTDKALAEQKHVADELAEMAGPAFDLAAERGAQAIGNMFRFSAALGLLRRGVAELIGLARFSRRLTAGAYADRALEAFQVRRPLEDLEAEVNRFAPRVEGADLQDIDRLVEYGRAQVERLPDTLREKVIGRVAAPAVYQREHLQQAQRRLNDVIREATVVDGSRLELAVRNALLTLAAWELVIFAVTIILRVAGLIRPEDGPTWALIVLLLAVAGFIWMPFQAIRVSRRYTDDIVRLRDVFLAVLDAAVQRHMTYARELRANAMQPYTRLVETQTAQIEAVRRDLVEVQQELAGAEQMIQSLK